MSKLKLLDDRVAIRPANKETVSQGGIVIPDNASKEEPSRGEVVYVGPGKKGEDGNPASLSVQSGDDILFSKYAGTKVKVNGEELLVMREEDILAIVEK